MSAKKTKEALAAANAWQKAQIQAAALAEELTKAQAVVEEHKAELDELTLTAVEENLKQRKKDVEDFLMTARNRYVEAIDRIGEEYFKPIDKVIKERLAE